MAGAEQRKAERADVKRIDVEQVTEPEAYHGEGPVWAESWGGLRFVDMLAGDVLAFDRTSGGLTRQHVGDVVAVIRPRRDVPGGMVAALEREFALIDPDGTVHGLGELWSDTNVRMNDGACDPDGRFFAGSMAYDVRPGAGALWRLDPDRSAVRVLDDVTISNGLAWSPDHTVAYYIDTPTQNVDAFDYDPETGLVVSTRRTVVSIPADQGSPDGMTVDAEGHLWVALWGGSAVHRYTPDGTLDAVVELPVTQVSACTFGGPELDELYITTSRQGLPAGRQPQAGALFRARPGVRGLPALAFAG